MRTIHTDTTTIALPVPPPTSPTAAAAAAPSELHVTNQANCSVQPQRGSLWGSENWMQTFGVGDDNIGFAWDDYHDDNNSMLSSFTSNTTLQQQQQHTTYPPNEVEELMGVDVQPQLRPIVSSPQHCCLDELETARLEWEATLEEQGQAYYIMDVWPQNRKRARREWLHAFFHNYSENDGCNMREDLKSALQLIYDINGSTMSASMPPGATAGFCATMEILLDDAHADHPDVERLQKFVFLMMLGHEAVLRDRITQLDLSSTPSTLKTINASKEDIASHRRRERLWQYLPALTENMQQQPFNQYNSQHLVNAFIMQAAELYESGVIPPFLMQMPPHPGSLLPAATDY